MSLIHPQYVVIFLLSAASLCQCSENHYYRLPNTVRPENYNLQILSHLGNGDEKTQFDFLGNVSIQVSNNYNCNNNYITYYN